MCFFARRLVEMISQIVNGDLSGLVGTKIDLKSLLVETSWNI